MSAISGLVAEGGGTSRMSIPEQVSRFHNLFSVIALLRLRGKKGNMPQRYANGKQGLLRCTGRQHHLTRRVGLWHTGASIPGR